jgi:autotransporter-associated beta strand protein
LYTFKYKYLQRIKRIFIKESTADRYLRLDRWMRTKTSSVLFVASFFAILLTTEPVQGNTVYKNLYTDVFSNDYTSTPSPVDITMDGSGNVYVADGGGGVYKFPSGSTTGTAIISGLLSPQGIVYNPHDSKLYISMTGKVVPYEYNGGVWGADADISGSPSFSSAQGMCCDSSGNIYVADAGNNCIYQIVSGIATALSVTEASPSFNTPQGVAIDPTGTYLYVSDTGNNLIRSINLTTQSGGVKTYPVTTLAGNYAYNDGTGPGNPSTSSATNRGQGYADGVGAAALFDTPKRLICDSAGTIFVADNGNRVIRKITKSGVVTTIAGTVGNDSFTPGMDLFAQLSPVALALNPTTGVIYVADQTNACIEYITPNYIAPYVAVNVYTSSDFGTYPITFAGGAMVLRNNVVLSNAINLSAPSLVVTNAYNLTLTDSLNSGTSHLISYGNGSINFGDGSNYLKAAGSDSSTQVISSARDYSNSSTNGILVAGGTLTIRADTSAGGPTIYVMNGVGSNNTAVNGTISFYGDIYIYNNICMIGSGTIDGNGNDASLYGVIGGPGDVTFTNSSNKVITLNTQIKDAKSNGYQTGNTYSGSTVIHTGVTLTANAPNVIAASSSVTVRGTFDLNGHAQLLNNIMGAGTIMDSKGADALTLNTTNSSSTFTGTLDSSLGAVTVVGSGVLTLSGTNRATSGLSIGGILNGIAVGGTLNVGAAGKLGRYYSVTVNVEDSRDGSNNITTTISDSDPGNSVTTSGTITTTTTTAAAVSALTFNQGGILQASAGFTLSNNVTLNGNAIIDCGGHTVGISGDVTDSSFCISAIGSGTLTLPSGYGGTVVYSGATVNNASSSSALSASPNNTDKGDTILPSSTTITASGSAAFSTGTVFLYGNSGTVIKAGGDLTIPNPVSLITAGSLDANSQTLTVTGPIAGSTGLTVHTTTGSTGTVALLGNNSYTGGTTVNSGVLLKIYDPMNIGSGTVTIQSGGAIQAVGNVTITRPLVFH